MSNRRQFGRVVKHDARDKQFSVLRHLPQTRESSRTHRYWNDGRWWGDQGYTPHCVAYAWLHWLADGPVTQPSPLPTIKPRVLYSEAQAADEIPGNDYDGTTVRGGAKVLRDRGLVAKFLWATSLEAVVNTILEVGPVVIGVNWYGGMMDPGRRGRIAPTGELVGGHAVVVNGVNVRAETLRIKNSWGRSWGDNGRAVISFEHFERLLAEDGEACIATEIKA